MNRNMKSIIATLAFSTALTTPTFGWQDQDADDNKKDVEEIVVSASKVKRALEDLSSSIAVVGDEEIKRQQMNDLNQLFKNTPGINVTGDSGSSQNITIRGMGADRVLMIKDGMRMNQGYGANGANDIVGRGFIDLDTLKQVEVAKGPASSSFGADAMGGIVAFTTKSASDYLEDGEDFYLSGRFGYAGVNDEHSYGGTTAFKIGDVGGLVSGNQRKGHETQTYGDTKPPMNISTLSVLAKLTYDFNENSSLSLTADIWDQTAETPDQGTGYIGPWSGFSSYWITSDDRLVDRVNESYKASYHYEGGSIDSLDISVYKNNSEQVDMKVEGLAGNNFFTGIPFTRQMYNDGTFKTDTTGFLSNLSGKFEAGGMKNQYAVGLDYETTTSSRYATKVYIQGGATITDEASNKFPRNEVKRLGIYIADYIDVSDDLTIDFGSRFDSYTMTPENDPANAFQYEEISKSRVSSKIGMVFKATDTLQFKGNFSQGFKVPDYDLAYIFQDNTFYGYVVEPTDHLDPETSKSFEFGMTVNTEKVNFSAHIFQNDFKNFIQIGYLRTEFPYGPTFPVDHFSYVNIDSVRIKGFEASVSYNVSNEINVYTNISYQDGKDRTSGDYITTINPLGGTVGASYTTDKIGGDISIRWASPMKKVDAGSYMNPGYAVGDISMYYKVVENATVRLGVSNFTNNAYTPFQAVSNLSAGADVTSRYRPGRSVNFNVSVDF